MTQETKNLEAALRELLDTCLKKRDSLHIQFNNKDRPKEKIIGSHCHSHWEFFAVIEGCMEFDSTSMPHLRLYEGEALMIPPGHPHRSVDAIPQPQRQKVCIINMPDGIEFQGAFAWLVNGGNIMHFGALPPEIVNRWAEIEEKTPTEMLSNIGKAFREGIWGKERACNATRHLLASLGAALAAPTCPGNAKQKDPRILKVIAMLHEEYHNPELSMKKLAQVANLSQPRLFELFRHMTGTTLRQILINIRLQNAKTLLENGRYSVKEVASMTGWRSQLYFSTAFRNRYGTPPSKLRKPSGLQ